MISTENLQAKLKTLAFHKRYREACQLFQEMKYAELIKEFGILLDQKEHLPDLTEVEETETTAAASSAVGTGDAGKEQANKNSSGKMEQVVKLLDMLLKVRFNRFTTSINAQTLLGLQSFALCSSFHTCARAPFY